MHKISARATVLASALILTISGGVAATAAASGPSDCDRAIARAEAGLQHQREVIIGTGTAYDIAVERHMELASNIAEDMRAEEAELEHQTKAYYDLKASC